jgi:hypothetical protein
MKIKPTETLLMGKWIALQGHLMADETCKRIIDLTTTHLILLGRYPSGWDALYRDPNDGRLWELTYPRSEMEEDGSPQLQHVTDESADEKYTAHAFPKTLENQWAQNPLENVNRLG